MWAGTSSRFRDFFSLFAFFTFILLFIESWFSFQPKTKNIYICILYIHAELWPPGLLSCRLVSSRNAFFLIYIYIHVDENLYGKLFMHSPVRRSILGIVIGVLYTCTFCRYVFLEWKHTKNHEKPFLLSPLSSISLLRKKKVNKQMFRFIDEHLSSFSPRKSVDIICNCTSFLSLNFLYRNWSARSNIFILFDLHRIFSTVYIILCVLSFWVELRYWYVIAGMA